jgi:hypothetical protein
VSKQHPAGRDCGVRAAAVGADKEEFHELPDTSVTLGHGIFGE